MDGGANCGSLTSQRAARLPHCNIIFIWLSMRFHRRGYHLDIWTGTGTGTWTWTGDSESESDSYSDFGLEQR